MLDKCLKSKWYQGRTRTGTPARPGDVQSLTVPDEVVTFINRNLEPYRGYHVFMRALPQLLRKRPKAHIVMLGGDGLSYGSRPPDGKTWKLMDWMLPSKGIKVCHNRDIQVA